MVAIVCTVPVAKTGWTAPLHVLNVEVYAAIYLPQTLNLMMTVTIHLRVEDTHTEADTLYMYNNKNRFFLSYPLLLIV